MKRILFTFLLVSVGYFCFSSDTYHGGDSPIKGPQGDISFKITLPKGFNPATDRCKIQRPRCFYMATATGSCRCGAAKICSKPTVTTPP